MSIKSPGNKISSHVREKSALGRRISAKCVVITVTDLSLCSLKISAANTTVICGVHGADGFCVIFFGQEFNIRAERGSRPLEEGAAMASIAMRLQIFCGEALSADFS